MSDFVKVKTPDGQVFKFPSSMSREEILNVMRDKFPPKQQENVVEDVARSAASGLARGAAKLGDLGGAALAYGIRKATPLDDQSFDEVLKSMPYNKAMTALIGEEYKPRTYLGEMAKVAGEAVGTLPLFGAGGLAAGTIGRTAAAGAASVPGADIGGAIGEKIGGETGEAIGQVVGGISGGVAGFKSPEIVTGAGKRSVNWIRSRKFEDVSEKILGKNFADAADDVSKVSEIQEILTKKYKVTKSAEKKAWEMSDDKGRKSYLPAENLKELSYKIKELAKDASTEDASSLLSRQAKRVDDYIERGSANITEIGRIRRTLSNASKRDGSLFESVKEIEKHLASSVDEIVGDKDAIESLSNAIRVSREKFSRFNDKKAVAAAIKDDATPEQFGAIMMGANSPANAKMAGTYIDQVFGAVGKGNRRQVQALIDQAVSHRILQVSRMNTGEQYWLGKLSNEVTNLKRRNPTLWNKLSPETRKGLNVLSQNAKKEQELGFINKAFDFILNRINNTSGVFGIKTNLRLPSTIAPKNVADFDEVVKLMKYRPKDLEKMNIKEGVK